MTNFFYTWHKFRHSDDIYTYINRLLNKKCVCVFVSLCAHVVIKDRDDANLYTAERLRGLQEFSGADFGDTVVNRVEFEFSVNETHGGCFFFINYISSKFAFVQTSADWL